MEGATSAMADLLSNLSPVVTAVFGYVVDVAETIVSTPLLLMTTGVLLAGAAVGLFGRFLSKG